MQMVSNFHYLYDCDVPFNIVEICRMAESHLIDWSYGDCAVHCRMAVEQYTRWLFEEELLFDRPNWYSQYTEVSVLIGSQEMRGALHDSILADSVNGKLRKTANEYLHQGKPVSYEEASQILKILFEFVLRLTKRVDSACNYTVPYFEPYLVDDSLTPRDYLKLMEETDQPEEKALLAILNKCSDAAFELKPYLEGLDEDSDAYRLLSVLCSQSQLRQMLMESSTQMRKLIHVNYKSFAAWEEQMVAALCVKECRRNVRLMYKKIIEELEKANVSSI